LFALIIYGEDANNEDAAYRLFFVLKFLWIQERSTRTWPKWEISKQNTLILCQITERENKNMADM
jgi:hypothetical protein